MKRSDAMGHDDKLYVELCSVLTINPKTAKEKGLRAAIVEAIETCAIEIENMYIPDNDENDVVYRHYGDGNYRDDYPFEEYINIPDELKLMNVNSPNSNNKGMLEQIEE